MSLQWGFYFRITQNRVETLPRAKGTPKTGGRAKGTPNKHTSDVRAAFLQAFDLRGGVDELTRLKPEIFYGCFSKLLPRETKVELEGGVLLTITRSFVRKPKDPEPGP